MARGLIVGSAAPSHSALLYVDLEGHAKVIWQRNVVFFRETEGVPSPDGRYLAFSVGTEDNNVWMLKTFYEQ